MNKTYAQLDQNNICVGVSELKAEVPEFNYETKVDINPITQETTTTEVFISRMIQIPIYSINYIGLRYTEEGNWEQPTA